MPARPDIDDILAIGSPEGFERAALEVFAFQARKCAPYREYIRLLGIDPGEVSSFGDIPYLPIELFKSHEVYCGEGEPQVVFTSSTTGGGEPSRHYMEKAGDYEKTFRRAFSHFYGDPAAYGFYALLPGYLEREGSSLIYMIASLIRSSRGGFHLRDHGALLADMAADPGPKILFGVSHALLDLTESRPGRLENTIVMETGGMKGQRAELPRGEFHAILREAFGVEAVHSEYGMAELASQAYSRGDGIFRCPPWMRVSVRDLNDPFESLPEGRSGGVNIIDLANISSCAFIQTQDIGRALPGGGFTIEGRITRSEIRGCNLLVQ